MYTSDQAIFVYIYIYSGFVGRDCIRCRCGSVSSMGVLMPLMPNNLGTLFFRPIWAPGFGMQCFSWGSTASYRDTNCQTTGSSNPVGILVDAAYCRCVFRLKGGKGSPMEFRPNTPMTWLQSFISSVAKHVAMILVWFMSEADLEDFSTKMLQVLGKFDEDSSISEWSVVSEEPASSTSNTSHAGLSGLSGSSTQCPHMRVSKKGSNHFVQIKRCKACGFLLSKELTGAGLKVQQTKAAKTNVQ